MRRDPEGIECGGGRSLGAAWAPWLGGGGGLGSNRHSAEFLGFSRSPTPTPATPDVYATTWGRTFVHRWRDSGMDACIRKLRVVDRSAADHHLEYRRFVVVSRRTASAVQHLCATASTGTLATKRCQELLTHMTMPALSELLRATGTRGERRSVLRATRSTNPPHRG